MRCLMVFKPSKSSFFNFNFNFDLITHKDIKPETKKYWKETHGRRDYYLKNGVKSSFSNVLLPIGALGLWEWWTKNPAFIRVFGNNGLIISILAIITGLTIIWVCDRIYEHYQLVQVEKQQTQYHELNNHINQDDEKILELTHELAELRVQQAVDEEATHILEKELHDLQSEHQHNQETIEKEIHDIHKHGLKNTIGHFIEDTLNE